MARRSLAIFAAFVLAATAGPGAAAEPVRLEVEGAYVHPASGVTFPRDLAGFERFSLYRNDVDGLSVSAGYGMRTPNGPIVITAYIHPAPPPLPGADAAGSCDAEYALRKGEIERAHPGATVVEEGAVATPAGAAAARRGRFAIMMESDGQWLPLRTELWLLCDVAGWTVQHRATGPSVPDTQDRVAAFAAAFALSIGDSGRTRREPGGRRP